jgi:hypothetical protein
MNLAGTSLSLFVAVAVISAVLAMATIWLVLTDPVGMADAVNQGSVTPLVRELASVILEALQGLLKYL